jgi:hypothetical protein
MEITVKKQVEETLQVETPAYYKDFIGNHCQINEEGVMTVVRKTIICLWHPSHGSSYSSELSQVIGEGRPCAREDFQTAYRATLERIQAAVDGVEETVNVNA